jgi:GT2 family glycosyltransferase
MAARAGEETRANLLLQLSEASLDLSAELSTRVVAGRHLYEEVKLGWQLQSGQIAELQPRLIAEVIRARRLEEKLDSRLQQQPSLVATAGHATRRLFAALTRSYQAEPVKDQNRNAANAIRSSGLFNAAYYLSHLPSSAGEPRDPLQHYLAVGEENGLKPHPLFDPSYYRSRYPEPSAAVGPLLDYLTGGWRDRAPNEWFDSAWYLSQYPDVAASGMNPLIHYVRYGCTERRLPGPGFEPNWYRTQHPLLTDPEIEPLSFHLDVGRYIGFRTLARQKESSPVLPAKTGPLFAPLKLPSIPQSSELDDSPAPLRPFSGTEHLPAIPDPAVAIQEESASGPAACLRSDERPASAEADPDAIQAALAANPFLSQREIAGHNRAYVVAQQTMIDWPRLQALAATRKRGQVSIVIPVLNLADMTEKCLLSILDATDYPDFEIIVVDNGSAPETGAELQRITSTLPKTRLVRNPVNMMFAMGCNIGGAVSTGEFIVFLNNDTEVVTRNWLADLISPLESDPLVGIVGGKLLYPDSTIQHAGIVFGEASRFPYHIYKGLPGNHPPAARRRVYRAVTGACLGIRAADFVGLRGFDAAFVNGSEDLDLCFRVQAALERACLYVPSAVLVHLEARSPGRGTHKMENRRLFVERWRDQIAPDDRAYYRQDGLVLDGYEQVDETKEAELGIIQPQLRSMLG